MGQGECKPCSTADPTTATVKVDATLLNQLDAKPAVSEITTQQAEEAERRRREAAAEQERLQRAAEEREADERRRQEAEARRQLELQRERAEAEAQVRRREQEEAELAGRSAEERAAAAEAARRAEEARAAAAAAAAKEQQEAQKKVDAFLRARGFTAVGAPQRKCFKTNYPLHAAAQENSAEMVRALLRCGADGSKKDSSGKTAREVAQKCSKKGSHDAVLVALVGAAP